MIGATKTIPVTCESPGKPAALESHLTKCPRLRIPTETNTALEIFTQDVCLIETSNERKQLTTIAFKNALFFQQAIIRFSYVYTRTGC